LELVFAGQMLTSSKQQCQSNEWKQKLNLVANKKNKNRKNTLWMQHSKNLIGKVVASYTTVLFDKKITTSNSSPFTIIQNNNFVAVLLSEYNS